MERKILIIHTAFIGDIVLTTPLIETVFEDFPGYRIDFLTIPSSVNLIESNPHITKVHVFDKRGADRGLRGLLRFGKILESEKYKICITPHRSFRSAYLTFRTKAEVRIGFDRSALRQAFTKVIDYHQELHEIGRNLSLLRGLGFRHQELLKPKIYATDEDKAAIHQLLFEHELIAKKNLIAIAPGSVWMTKRWPEENYAQLVRLLQEAGQEVLLIGGEEDKALCQRIAGEVPGVLSFAGELSLRQSYHILNFCNALVTNDYAPLHLGMAADVYVFAIFGATVPAFGFAPFGEKGIVIEQHGLKCRPCGIHGGNVCPVKTFDCMIRTTPEDVFNKVSRTLGLENGLSEN